MKNYLRLAATIAAVFVGAPAQAADVGMSTYDWSGPYMGIGAGYLWCNTKLF
jgi:opacity protein-like surface antigen